MTPNRREALIRAALSEVGDEMLGLDASKSGSVTIHFQNGIPQKTEWRLLARPLKPLLTGTDDM